MLAGQGRRIRTTRHLPRRGLAEHRAVMLAASSAPFSLFCDDDAWLEPGVVGRLHEAIVELGAGWSARPSRPVLPARPPTGRARTVRAVVGPSGARADRARAAGVATLDLHNAANPVHLARRHLRPDERWLAYKIAWVGGCVLYERAVLDAVGASTSGPTCLPRTAEKMCWCSTGCWRGLAWPA
jgi:hypothetical protein